jgi:signal transduction histidine kinase
MVPRLISFAVLACFAANAAAAQTAANSAATPTKQVLILFSGESLLPANNAIGASLQAGLKSEDAGRIEVFTEFLDADRFQGAEHATRMAAFLKLARSELIERNMTVGTRLTPGLPRTSGDSIQLQQVLLNLLLNACEAMSANRPAERTLTVSTARDGDGHVLTSIANRGCGIPTDAADRLFEPFFTTKPQGLGLGLSICRSIISAHGGRLWAENNIDRGAMFTFALPAQQEGHH